jgi:hypothetical protein
MFAHFFALSIPSLPTFYRFFFSDEAQFIMLQFTEDYVVLAITSSFSRDGNLQFSLEHLKRSVILQKAGAEVVAA